MTTTIAATHIGALVVGGVEVDDVTVVCFDLWSREPVYHRYGSWQHDTAKWEIDATACGRATWNNERKQSVGTMLPIYHAEAIGRPCLRCFPEAREALAYKREVSS